MGSAPPEKRKVYNRTTYEVHGKKYQQERKAKYDSDPVYKEKVKEWRRITYQNRKKKQENKDV